MALEKGISNKGSEGGQEKVVSPFFGEGQQNKASQEAVGDMMSGKKAGAAGAAAQRETSAPLPVGADMPGMGADRFSKVLAQATPSDKSFSPAAALGQKGGTMENASGQAAHEKVINAMVNDKPLNQPQPKENPLPNVHLADSSGDQPKKKAS